MCQAHTPCYSFTLTNNPAFLPRMRRGFMCQSVEVTSGCTIPDTRNVIVPRRVVGKSDGSLTRLIEINKARFGDRKEANAARGSQSFVQRTAPSSAVNLSDNVFQVVVMRVSLHCQGCAGKVKKHLSKMEGVTSFSIELEEKRVTVRGCVSPAGVLESISKVKRAEFWSSFDDEFGQ